MEYDERSEEATGYRETRKRGAHMGKAGRAVILSGLIFPGLGQVYLKRYGRGVVIMLLVAIGLTLLISVATRDALSLLNQLEMQGETIDFQTLLDVTAEASAARSGSYTALFLLVAGCWLFSMLDAYSIGNTKNLSDE